MGAYIDFMHNSNKECVEQIEQSNNRIVSDRDTTSTVRRSYTDVVRKRGREKNDNITEGIIVTLSGKTRLPIFDLHGIAIKR